MLWFLALVWFVVCPILAAMLAERKGRDPKLGVLLGFLLGIFGLFIVMAMAPIDLIRTATCPHCREQVHPEALACPHCQRDWNQGDFDEDLVQSTNANAEPGEMIWCVEQIPSLPSSAMGEAADQFHGRASELCGTCFGELWEIASGIAQSD